MSQVPPDESPLGADLDLSSPNSPLAPYFLNSSHVAAAVVVALVIAFYSLAPLWHTDVWGHLKYGEWVLEHGSSPPQEPFCEFSDQSITLVNFSWLAQVIFTWAYRAGATLAGGDEVRQLAGGVAGLRLLSLLLAASTTIFLLLACARASSSVLVGTLALLGYNLLAPTALGVLRPQLFGQALFAFFLWALSGPRLSWPLLAAMALGMALWANCHGSFIIGLALLGAFLGGRVIEVSFSEGWRPLAAIEDDRARQLLLALIVVALAAMLNPYGPMLYHDVLAFGGSETVKTFDEHQPLNFTLGPIALIVYLAAAVLLLASWALARKPPSATGVLLILLFALLPVLRRRFLVWWMPLVPFLAAPVWADLLKRCWGSAELPGEPNLRKTVMVALAGFVALAFTPPIQWLIRGPAPLPYSLAKETPWEVALALEGNAPTGTRAARLQEEIGQAFEGRPFRGRIFTSETAGDFLIWRRPAPSGVLVYTHIHLFDMGHWSKCMRVKSAEPDWDDILDGWGVNLIVVEAGNHSDLCREVRRHSKWRAIGGPGPVFVAVRKAPLPAAPPRP